MKMSCYCVLWCARRTGGGFVALPGFSRSGNASCGTCSDVVVAGTRVCQSPIVVRKSSASLDSGTERMRRAYVGKADSTPIYAPVRVKKVMLPYFRNGGSGGFPLRAFDAQFQRAYQQKGVLC